MTDTWADRDSANSPEPPPLQKIQPSVAQVDVLSSFAAVAAEQGYCRPEVDLSDAIEDRKSVV